MTSLDLDAIESEFLKQCGACAVGLPTACVCSPRDFRPTMTDLLGEVATLRRVMLAAADRLSKQANVAEVAADLRAEAGQ